MDQGASKLWEEMLEEFRTLGGRADNICLRSGRFGRGLFPLDPKIPVSIHIPESLLVSHEHVRIENGAVRFAPEAQIGERERRFLESYQRDFSWGVGHRETEALLQMFQDAPGELRELLKSPFHLDPWLEGPTAEAVRERFFTARVIRYKDKPVIMPIVELANHGRGVSYRRSDDGVGLSGLFDDEILVGYHNGDPLSIFHGWGFVSDAECFALSLPLGMRQARLVIERNDLKATGGHNLFYPSVQKKGDQLLLSHMLLGHKQAPRIPRGIFFRVLGEAGGGNAAELFDHIQHSNRMRFLRLIELSEDATPELGRLLRSLAYAQLKLMSSNFGVRDV